MWDFFNKLIDGIDENIKIKDFVIGARWTAVPQ